MFDTTAFVVKRECMKPRIKEYLTRKPKYGPL